MQAHNALKALANPRRRQILEWLKNPRAHFKTQVDGDLVNDGVCAILIAEKLGITQATLSEHMRVLVETGMVNPKRIKQWIFYRRNEQAIARLKSEILDKI